jgi:hypothetical protein
VLRAVSSDALKMRADHQTFRAAGEPRKYPDELINPLLL